MQEEVSFLHDGGEMGQLIRHKDWASHVLGLPENWPAALKVATGIMLSSKFPMLICWGEDFIQLYNDSFRPINGITKHPQALGGSAKDTYAEIWDTIGPLFTGVMKGSAVGFSDFRVPLERNGSPEDCYFDFSYSPIRHEDGAIGGILVVCLETTDKLSAQTSKLLADQQLQNTADTLKLAMATANMGTWYADLQKDTLILAERSKVIHGIPAEVDPSFSEATLLIPVENRQNVLDQIFHAIDEHQEFDIQYQINPMDGGKQKWIRSTGMGYYDEEGKALSILGTIFDITEQKEDEQRKNDFIGMVSHELKTPLTTLTAVVQAAGIKLKNHPDKFIAGAMERAGIQVKKMTKLINGFLSVSRLESGKIVIEKEIFELDALLEELIQETELMAVNHAIHFDACSTVKVNADRDKIASVISNLVNNAIKYSPGAKLIDIQCAIHDSQAVVSVRDYGMGVKRQDRAKLFDRFYRVASNTTQNISGFGIGLYLSAEIIRRHDGKIWVDSEYGHGSTFYFSLPVYSK